MFTDEFLNDGNCPSCQKCTEDSAYSDSIKSVKDCKGQITWENICRNDWKHAVVGEADAKTHQKKTCEKIQNIQRLCIWQMLNPEIVYINHFTEPNANYKGKQVACTKGTFQNHQSDHKQCLENIIPCTETKYWKGNIKNKWYRGNG